MFFTGIALKVCFEDFIQLFLRYVDKTIMVYEMYGHIIGKGMSTVIWKQV